MNLLSRAINKFLALRVVDDRVLYTLPEREHLEKLFEFLKVDCVFDVGANIGQYATMLRKKVGYRGLIISFEPIPEAATTLRTLAAGDPMWDIEQLALASDDGERSFNVMKDSQFSSLANPDHSEIARFRSQNTPSSTIVVKTETLSSAFVRLQSKFGFRRPFLKMDTQGLDVEIVKSGTDVLPEFVGLQSELAIKKLYDLSTDFREAVTFYQSQGFEMSAIVQNNRGHFPLLIEANCIMLRKDLCR
ncbi:FkbM family methyltransferase [Bradyrhizobium sp. AT1]|uniref:FkbM family methyltransferase n=1 Tax=Bradyrhizobium sp. AT1 TaxID=574934 RepID=UPI00079997B7|nr:FkbM family methyltransferase [Bradyrhizobium sp. AT1]KYG21667.1 FkbM family methyltransferase [Bradyrhizobium sp. AT1]